jgi:hypothetical protein
LLFEVGLEVLHHLPRDVLRHARRLDAEHVRRVPRRPHRIERRQVARDNLDLELRRSLEGLAVVIVELVRVGHDDYLAAAFGGGLTGREDGCGRGGGGNGAGSDQHLSA